VIQGTQSDLMVAVDGIRRACSCAGFHMGLLDPDSLVEKDVDALAETVARCVPLFTCLGGARPCCFEMQPLQSTVRFDSHLCSLHLEADE
jgi:hypothetical protein